MGSLDNNLPLMPLTVLVSGDNTGDQTGTATYVPRTMLFTMSVHVTLI